MSTTDQGVIVFRALGTLMKNGVRPFSLNELTTACNLSAEKILQIICPFIENGSIIMIMHHNCNNCKTIFNLDNSAGSQISTTDEICKIQCPNCKCDLELQKSNVFMGYHITNPLKAFINGVIFS